MADNKKKLVLIVNCQVKINKNSHIKLSNYSHIKNISLSTGFYPALFLFTAKYFVR